MLIAVRVVGLLLFILGAGNLAGLLIIEPSALISPGTVLVRYSLMVTAGIGFMLSYRWAVLVYASSVAFNWVAFFLIYDEQSVGPIWLSFPIPIAIAVLSYFAWDRLKPPRVRRKPSECGKIDAP